MPDVDATRARWRTLLAAGTVLIALLALPAVGRAVTIKTFPLPTGASSPLDIVHGPDGAL